MKSFFSILLGGFTFLASCQHPSDKELPTSTESDLTSSAAMNVAQNFDLLLAMPSRTKSTTAARVGFKDKAVKEIFGKKDKEGRMLYYVIRYQEGGFIIVSAEKKMTPILAFSETGDFPTDKELPAGVNGTMSAFSEMIIKFRSGEISVDSATIRDWERIEKASEATKRLQPGGRPQSEPTDPPCQDNQYYIAPLLTTGWDQGCGYNGNMPISACNDCGHNLTGCVATAMAQVMNYHHFPSTFNWGSQGSLVNRVPRHS